MKEVGVRSQVRKAIQASVFRTLGFDVGHFASGLSCDAVFVELAKFGVEAPSALLLIDADPIDELRTEPLLGDDD